jgi:hypothetical protein
VQNAPASNLNERITAACVNDVSRKWIIIVQSVFFNWQILTDMTWLGQNAGLRRYNAYH